MIALSFSAGMNNSWLCLNLTLSLEFYFVLFFCSLYVVHIIWAPVQRKWRFLCKYSIVFFAMFIIYVNFLCTFFFISKLKADDVSAYSDECDE